MPNLAFTESLESRTFLSASPASSALSTAVQADQLQIKQDLLQFRSDAVGNMVMLTTDINAIKADDPKNAKTVRPLIAKFRHDVLAMSVQLRLDRLTQAHNVLADEAIIVGIHRKMLLDKGNPTAEAADKSALLAERIKLQQDMINGLNARLTTRQNATDAIFADGQAIVTAAQSDPNASPQLVTDVQKWTTDKAAAMSTIAIDLQKLMTDRTQLVTDLTAMQSQA